MSVHIGAERGDIAETVLLPGDPLRAKWVAENFFTKPRLVNEVRGMLGYTGTWRGNPVSVHGTGMGMPSLSIYVNELIRDFGAKTLIRIGSTGAMQRDVNVRDLVIAQAASTCGSPSAAIFKELSFAPIADWGLLNSAHKAALDKAYPVHVGGVYCTDVFYAGRPDLIEVLTEHGTLSVEMETAELYILAARYKCRALSILTVSDHLITGEDLPAIEREKSFSEMVEIALETAFA